MWLRLNIHRLGFCCTLNAYSLHLLSTTILLTFLMGCVFLFPMSGITQHCLSLVIFNLHNDLLFHPCLHRRQEFLHWLLYCVCKSQIFIKSSAYKMWLNTISVLITSMFYYQETQSSFKSTHSYKTPEGNYEIHIAWYILRLLKNW